MLRICKHILTVLFKNTTNERIQARRGRLGEKVARRFLKKEAGFRILAKNWRYKNDELDIIAIDEGVLVFVEVKSRDSSNPTPGYYAATTKQKKEALRRASKAFLKSMKHPPKHHRFDVVAVKFCQNDTISVKHYRNVSLHHKHFSSQ